jgi:hypothetical protein
MGYSNFKKIKTVVRRFNLDLQMLRLFGDTKPVSPSEWLEESLATSDFLPLTNEKAKAERIISPVLIEVAKAYKQKVSFFSGESIDIDTQADLAGPCDFFFSLQSLKPYIEAPIISLAEAKDEDMEWGIAQCGAQMYGAHLFNQQEGKDIPFVYGCATDGVEWQFMRFESNVFYLDTKIYTDLKEILGVWHHIIQLFLK